MPDDKIAANGGDTLGCELLSGGIDPQTELLTTIADLEGVTANQLEPLYYRIDDIVRRMCSDPPNSEAAVELSFTYQRYRITVQQDGRCFFQKLECAKSSDSLFPICSSCRDGEQYRQSKPTWNS